VVSPALKDWLGVAFDNVVYSVLRVPIEVERTRSGWNPPALNFSETKQENAATMVSEGNQFLG